MHAETEDNYHNYHTSGPKMGFVFMGHVISQTSQLTIQETEIELECQIDIKFEEGSEWFSHLKYKDR